MTSRASESIGEPTVHSAGPAVQQLARGTSPLLSACVAAAFLAFCLLVQYVSGAWSAGFVAYPDEPSHFVGAAMFRDWLVSGQWFTPLEFARNYYDHYPYFAVGYWPPLFSVVTGLWMLVAGVGRVQALFIPAVFAAGTAWLISEFVRRQSVRPRAGFLAGLCAGTIYLSLPASRQWMCLVMVDHMTTFLCIAAAACLLRYLKQPDFGRGSLCAVVSACAILSKYSAAYIVVLPFAAVVFLRRFELLKKPSLLVQPLIIGLMVGPWVLWTRTLTFYGLPAEREPLSVHRAASFVQETFQIFPPALLAVVVGGLIVLGVIVLLIRPRVWREDLTVWSLLAVGHLAFLFLSPVGQDESRYVLVPAAVLLAVSIAGWSEAAAFAPPRWTGFFVPVAAGGLTLAFVAAQFHHVARLPQDQIGNVVASIVKNPAWAAERIVVPPTLEGAVIAEFVVHSRRRPNDNLLRPSKILARTDWFSRNYSSTFATADEMMEYFRKNPVNLVMWDDRPEVPLKTHERILGEMLRQYPAVWHKVLPTDASGAASSSTTPSSTSSSTASSMASWAIYEYGDPQSR